MKSGIMSLKPAFIKVILLKAFKKGVTGIKFPINFINGGIANEGHEYPHIKKNGYEVKEKNWSASTFLLKKDARNKSKQITETRNINVKAIVKGKLPLKLNLYI